MHSAHHLPNAANQLPHGLLVGALPAVRCDDKETTKRFGDQAPAPTFNNSQKQITMSMQNNTLQIVNP